MPATSESLNRTYILYATKWLHFCLNDDIRTNGALDDGPLGNRTVDKASKVQTNGMAVSVREVSQDSVMDLRVEMLDQTQCQFIKFSALGRGFVRVFEFGDPNPFGYGILQTKYDPDAIVEFYCRPSCSGLAQEAFAAFVIASGAKEVLAQSNMPELFGLMQENAAKLETRSILFCDARESALECSATIRPVKKGEAIFEHFGEPVGSWCAEVEGKIVATAGYLTHYNPPYADVFMEVEASWRNMGIGSCLVPEVMKVIRQEGLVPAARCNPDNEASRRTLEKAGFEVCGEYVSGLL